MVGTSTGSGKFDVSLEVRDLHTLELVGPSRSVRSGVSLGSNLRPLVSGFTCHTPSGDDVSYLYPFLRRDQPAELHIWNGDNIEVIPGADMLAAVVDPAGEKAYLVEAGDSMAQIVTVDLASREREEFRSSSAETTSAWIALSADGKNLAVAAGRSEKSTVVLLLGTDGEQYFRFITRASGILGLEWSGQRAALTTSGGSGVIGTSFAHLKGWISKPVKVPPYLSAHAAVVGRELIMQLGEESLAVSSIASPHLESSNALSSFPPLA